MSNPIKQEYFSSSTKNTSGHELVIVTQQELDQCIKNGITKNLHVKCNDVSVIIDAAEMKNQRDIETWTFTDNGYLLFRDFNYVKIHLPYNAANRYRFEQCDGCHIVTSHDIDICANDIDEREVQLVECRRTAFESTSSADHIYAHSCKHCNIHCNYVDRFYNMDMCEFHICGPRKIKAKKPFMSCDSSIVIFSNCTIAVNNEIIGHSTNSEFVFENTDLLIPYKKIDDICTAENCSNNKFILGYDSKHYVQQNNS